MDGFKNKINNLLRNSGRKAVQFDSIALDEILKSGETEVCADAFEYLSNSIPASNIGFGGIVLLCRDGILRENRDVIPGCLIVKFGFVSIGITSGGDVFSMDCENGKVYEISHEKYNPLSISPGWKSDFSGFQADLPITRENIIKTSDHMFDGINQFLDFLGDQGMKLVNIL